MELAPNLKESNKYNSQWKLVVPEDVFLMPEQGGIPLV
jgi:hypothetical protein